MLIILFGLPGAGKNAVGRVWATLAHAHFHDADLDLPPAMQGYIQRGEVVPDAVRDVYFDVVTQRIGELQTQHPRLMVGQALIKEKHRQQIAARFPHAKFVWVQAREEIRQERLEHRQAHPLPRLASDYAQHMASYFDPPQLPHEVLLNEGTLDDLTQTLTSEGWLNSPF